MATHSSVLAWRIPGREEPGGLPPMGLQSRTRLKRLSSSSSKRPNWDFLPVQRLRLYAPKAGAWVQSLARELRSCMLHGTAEEINIKGKKRDQTNLIIL